MRERPILAGVIVIIIIIVGYINIAEPFSVIHENEKSITDIVGLYLQYMYITPGSDIYSIEEDDINPTVLENMTGFLWDSAYAFEPGTTKSEIESIIGFKDRHIPEVVEQGKAQLLFVYKAWVTEKDKVVCNIYGDTRYIFYLGEFKDKYIKLESSKTPVFRKKVVDGVLVFVLTRYDKQDVYSPWFEKDGD